MSSGSPGVGKDLGVDLVMFEGFGEKLRIFQIRGRIRTEENPSAIPDPPTRLINRC